MMTSWPFLAREDKFSADLPHTVTSTKVVICWHSPSPSLKNSLLAIVAEATGVPELVSLKVELATRYHCHLRELLRYFGPSLSKLYLAEDILDDPHANLMLAASGNSLACTMILGKRVNIGRMLFINRVFENWFEFSKFGIAVLPLSNVTFLTWTEGMRGLPIAQRVAGTPMQGSLARKLSSYLKEL
jgi:hypothetical protein